jgi:hypothetical protein
MIDSIGGLITRSTNLDTYNLTIDHIKRAIERINMVPTYNWSPLFLSDVKQTIKELEHADDMLSTILPYNRKIIFSLRV